MFRAATRPVPPSCVKSTVPRTIVQTRLPNRLTSCSILVTSLPRSVANRGQTTILTKHRKTMMKRPSESTLLDTSGRPVGIHAWSKCDYHLLKLLTSGPLLPTKSQLCQPGLRGLFSRTAIRSALRNLRNEGWLQRYNVHIHNPQLPDQPLLVCQSGQACPNFRELKAMLKGRDHQSLTWQSLHA